MISKRDILIIACKMLGLLCLIWGLAAIPQAIPVIMSLFQVPDIWWSTGTLAKLVLYFMCAFILLKWSEGVASFLAHEEQPVQVAPGKDWQTPLYALCLRVVGVVVVVKGIPEFIRWFSPIAFRPRGAAAATAGMWAELLVAIVYLVLGIYLVGGAPLIAKLALKRSLRE